MKFIQHLTAVITLIGLISIGSIYDANATETTGTTETIAKNTAKGDCHITVTSKNNWSIHEGNNLTLETNKGVIKTWYNVESGDQFVGTHNFTHKGRIYLKLYKANGLSSITIRYSLVCEPVTPETTVTTAAPQTTMTPETTIETVQTTQTTLQQQQLSTTITTQPTPETIPTVAKTQPKKVKAQVDKPLKKQPRTAG